MRGTLIDEREREKKKNPKWRSCLAHTHTNKRNFYELRPDTQFKYTTSKWRSSELAVKKYLHTHERKKKSSQ